MPSNPVHQEHQLKRWMRPDAHNFVRPDWRRFVRPGYENEIPLVLYERKYSPDQPRAPAGGPDGGQWTSGGGTGRNDHRVISDATPDAIKPGAQYAQNRPRGTVFGSVLINGQLVETTPAQAARLVVVEAQARDALARVRELDPKWQPTPSMRNTVEGEIAAVQAEAREAETRLSELARAGIGPGPYAGDSIPARGPERDFNANERREINAIGSNTGCHTCGILDPGTRSENFVADHQPPTALNFLGRPQRLFPQCIHCSDSQGGWISGNRRGR